ncbi:hypothetical protein GCM10027425_19210 [Alteromonas gracilis]
MDEHIEVVGVGRVTAVPDEALVRLTVEVSGPDVATALDSCASRCRTLLAALHAEDVAAADIATRQLAVHPRWHHERQEVVGHVAQQQYAVRLRDAERIGPVVSAATRACGDDVRIDDLAWGVSDTAALETEARTRAMTHARIKAEELAAGAGRRLGPVLGIRETDDGGGPGVPEMRLAASGTDLPVSAGSTEVVQQFVVRWALH